jgi:hypothetical protein
MRGFDRPSASLHQVSESPGGQQGSVRRITSAAGDDHLLDIVYQRAEMAGRPDCSQISVEMGSDRPRIGAANVQS